MNSKDTGNSIKIGFKPGRDRMPGDLARNQILQLLADKPRERSLLVEYLHLIQDEYRQISAAHIIVLADILGLASTEVYEVATFYHHFDVVKAHDPVIPHVTVRVCESITCEMFGSRQLLDSLRETLGAGIRVQPVPCVGRCDQAPVAVVGSQPVSHANAPLVADICRKKMITPALPAYTDFCSYRNNGGYQVLERCRQRQFSPEQVITILKDSNLRGLGGAGFPAGAKWEILRQKPKPRLIAVNIDEGEPGTFKDRYYLERDPHFFLEGALIAAWAIEADEIFIYIRDEYTACRQLLKKEIAAVNNHLNDVPKMHLRRGAGAYICGEESAMIESIEGKRGMPRLRPPYVADVGLFGRPTLEHNMETLYWVPKIIAEGADWFCSAGRHGRNGLRSFSVSGRVKKAGVYMAPAGITVRELIDEYCGGMQDGHEFYGYFPGGASGGMLPASLGDVPLDFDTLNRYGSFIGSAAVIVFSRHDSARQLALNTMRFFRDESCGQCTPCRTGTAKAVELMEEPSWDKPLLSELATIMVDASICGLGQAAPNPMLCAMKYFPEEFE